MDAAHPNVFIPPHPPIPDAGTAVLQLPACDPHQCARHVDRGGIPGGRAGPTRPRPQPHADQCAGRDPSRAGRESTRTIAARRHRSASCARSPATACCSATARTGAISDAPSPRRSHRARCRCWHATSSPARRRRSPRSARRPTSRWICSPPCRTWRSTSPAARCSRWRPGNTAPRCAGCSPSTAVNYAQPHLLDMVLPPSIPTLRDLGRRRFQRRWMALMAEVMQARLAAPAADDAARSVRSAARRARSGNRRGFLARPTARSDRDDDPGGTRDHGGDAVLVAGAAERRAG